MLVRWTREVPQVLEFWGDPEQVRQRAGIMLPVHGQGAVAIKLMSLAVRLQA